MTIICAAQGVDGWWLGSDTVMMLAGDPIPVGPKWCIADGVAIGVSGSHRAFALLANNLAHVTAKRDAWAIASAWRALLEDDGFEPKSEPSGPKCYEASGLIVIPGNGIWYVDGAQVPCHVKLPFMAAGAGTDAALGAAWVHQRNPAPSAQAMVRDAVGAAIALIGGCGGEPWIHRMGNPQ